MAPTFPRRSRHDQENATSSLAIHNIVVGGHRTSVRLEPQMWDALQDIARRLRATVHDLVTEIDRTRTASSLTAAIRVYIVDFYRAAALPSGNRQALRSPLLLDPADPELHHVV
jgi:predicted DNA-binding ribbon-helix-helix protein